ncbi:MAG: class I SAM-dependent methyltransferase [Myxococcota bacterium]
MSLKSTITQKFPALISLYHWLRMLPNRAMLRLLSREAVFTRRYRQGGWQSDESVSGSGSSERETSAIRAALPELVRETGARSFLDIPCGDFNWMQAIDLGIEAYIGADIVDDLVAKNRERHAALGREFRKLDLINGDLPKVDMVFCRDCLVHLSTSEVRSAIDNIIRSGSTYLLTTTFTQREANDEILTGEWRPLNLQAAPFDFPEPVRLIDEACGEYGGRFSDKHLGLWKISDLAAALR